MIFIVIMINIVGIIDCLYSYLLLWHYYCFQSFVLFFVIQKRENFKMLF